MGGREEGMLSICCSLCVVLLYDVCFLSCRLVSRRWSGKVCMVV